MIRILFFFLFLFTFSCAIKQEDVNKAQWQYHYDLGMSSYMAKNYSEAIANFFRASQLSPQEPKVWNALGLAYMEVQEYQKSENAFIRALQVDKAYSDAKLNLGILYYRQRDYEKSIKVLKEVIEDEAFPQKHMAFYYLGRVYQAMGNNRDYINYLKRATAYNPMFVDAQLELAQAYEGLGDYISAKDVYLNLINNGINNPSIDLSMARVEHFLGNHSSAKNYIKRVLEDRQSTPQLRAQAYDLLSAVLIAEQGRTLPQRLDVEAPKIDDDNQSRREKPREVIGTPELTAKESPPQDTPPSKARVYRIQVGAFSSVDSAKAWRERLEKEIKLKNLVVIESSGVFKVLYGAFNSREEATRELERLKNMNVYGFIIQE
ncbi:MAG: tetratricopeptide repeat protein [Aquificaceae bacterium]|nr:tetratricopeptide repeat protein [Aquificaceae bacterium]